jgi:hypothetical protein
MGTACGETEESCVEDCVDAVCGDGKCEGPETPAGCPKDCAVTVCGNGVCEAGENAQDCPADCTTVCGNCVCEVGENGTSCPPDCGYCGDGVCSNCPGKNEDPGTCPADCCIPACTGIQCGDDGCGGVCGMCAETQECSFGLCLDVGDECQDGNMVPWDGCSAGKITEFRVNTVTMSDQRGPDVAVMTDGSFVVTWASDGQDGNGWGVFGQRFAADGKKASVEFELNAYENGNQGTADCPPRVAALPDGGFVAAWPGQFKDGSGMGGGDASLRYRR